MVGNAPTIPFLSPQETATVPPARPKITNHHLRYWIESARVSSALRDTPAVVLFSGGQDSTTVLALAKALHGAAHTIALSCNYDQRHVIELKCGAAICEELGVEHRIIDLTFLARTVKTKLTSKVPETLTFHDKHARLSELPASFVPARNALMLTTAFALAGEIGARRVYTGVCQTDYSGYPDCREPFLSALQGALQTGYQQATEFVAPIMHLTKGETFYLADQIWALPLVVEKSHTCYNGDRSRMNSWGRGCGSCAACELRAKGWEEYRTLCGKKR